MKKIISDDNPIFVNIWIFTLLSGFVFILVLTPTVLNALRHNPYVLEYATEAVYGTQTSVQKILVSIQSIIEMFYVGWLIEFIRRKRSVKFTFSSSIAKTFYLYIGIGLVLYIGLKLIYPFM